MRLQILLFSLAIIFGFQTNLSSANSTQSGIEPILAEEFNNVEPPITKDYAKVEKEEKKGLGKIFSWIQKKSEKVLSFFGISTGSASGGFSILGFILGFFLGLIGVLLAYIFMDGTGVKSAWIGFAVWVVIVLFAFVL